MSDTKIGWVMNPDGTAGRTLELSGGCSKASSGCDNCFAARLCATRHAHLPNWRGLAVRGNGTDGTYGTYDWTGEFRLFEKNLLVPLGVQTPTTWFVNSRSDLFHEQMTQTFLIRAFAMMAVAGMHGHTFLLLTKRPGLAVGFLSFLQTVLRDPFLAEVASFCTKGDPKPLVEWVEKRGLPLPNVALGVSIEDQAAANERVPILLQTPAAYRFVSAEPMLGAVDISRYLGVQHEDELGIDNPDQSLPEAVGLNMHDPWVRGLDWVICGGETGSGARPMHPDWVRGLRDQCVAAGVPFFLKSWGDWWPYFAYDDDMLPIYCFSDGEESTSLYGPPPPGVPACPRNDDPRIHHWQVFDDADIEASYRVGHKRAGNVLDGVVWEQRLEVRG